MSISKYSFAGWRIIAVFLGLFVCIGVVMALTPKTKETAQQKSPVPTPLSSTIATATPKMVSPAPEKSVKATYRFTVHPGFPEYIFTLTSGNPMGSLAITDGTTGALMQTIEVEYTGYEKYMLQASEDYNFDGYNDLLFDASIEYTYANPSVWLFDPSLGQFVFNKDMTGFRNIMVDPKTKTLGFEDLYQNGGGIRSFEWSPAGNLIERSSSYTSYVTILSGQTADVSDDTAYTIDSKIIDGSIVARILDTEGQMSPAAEENIICEIDYTDSTSCLMRGSWYDCENIHIPAHIQEKHRQEQKDGICQSVPDAPTITVSGQFHYDNATLYETFSTDSPPFNKQSLLTTGLSDPTRSYIPGDLIQFPFEKELLYEAGLTDDVCILMADAELEVDHHEFVKKTDDGTSIYTVHFLKMLSYGMLQNNCEYR